MASDNNQQSDLDEQQDKNQITQISLELKSRNQELVALKASMQELIAKQSKETDAALQANLAKSQFLANMSHEIRTPLTAIIGFAEILRREKLNAQLTEKYLTTIIDNANNLTELLSEILDLSNIEANNLPLQNKRFNLGSLLAELNELHQVRAQSKSLKLNFDVSAGIPQWIGSDPIRLKQVLHNLLSNAIKFTEKGEITLSVHTQWDNGMLFFKVKDTGTGINSDQQSYIFDSFKQVDDKVTRQHGGSGLGLSIAKQLTQLMGGELRVQSQLKKGSEFSASIKSSTLEGKLLTLPSIRHTSTSIQNGDIPQLRGNVLLVEDTLTIQQLISRYVESTGATVTVADNGQLGIEQAISEEFDLVLMDIQMPVMDGKEALKGLLQLGYSKPVYALTANVMQNDVEEYEQIGFRGTLAKPLNLPAFFAVLAQHLAKASDNKRQTRDQVLASLSARTNELRPFFLKSLTGQYHELIAFLEVDDYINIGKILHVIKGSAGSFGYGALTDSANDAITMLKQQKQTEATMLINKVIVQVNDIISTEDE
ncbi:ATP-binding protein [Alteromonadaceae bacterium BrNp21-10]|nr:ATP-binding protein [Alteromonadaceae bacterium BrNp21-10]